MKPFLGFLTLIIFYLTFSLIFGGITENVSAQPQCSINPSSVPAGQVITITASGLDPNKNYEFQYREENSINVTIIPMGRTDSNGRITKTIVIPSDRPPGQYSASISPSPTFSEGTRCSFLSLTILAPTPTPTSVPPGGAPPGAQETCTEGVSTALGCISTEPGGFVNNILTIALGIAGGIAFILMVFGAFRLITSTGNPEGLQEGWSILGSAIAGLLFIIFSVFLLRVIGVDILKIF